MTHKPAKSVPFPTREQVLAFIREAGGAVGRREIARAFQITGAQRTELRALLKDLESEGDVQRGRGRRLRPPGTLPEVTVLTVTHQDADGDLYCKPVVWPHEEPPPRILLWPARRDGRAAAGIAPAVGDRVLARLSQAGENRYDARPIRVLEHGPSRVLGVLAEGRDGLRLRPTSRKERDDYRVAPTDTQGAGPGDLVEVEVLPGRALGLRRARVVDRLGEQDGPRSISLIVVHTHDIPVDFPPEALEQAEAATGVGLEGRADLRDIPFVTIDGEDARDFDDAVFADSDLDPDNPGGWTVWVAIADVAHYVRPGDPLDKAAFERGNSVYFPDRVVPMLPEALSNGWCSLRPNEDRGCLAVRLTFAADGTLLGHAFTRGLMRSAARLTYTQAQAARDGTPDDTTAPLMDRVITPLFEAYAALKEARKRRGCLELDLPERQVLLNEAGQVRCVVPRPRYDSHRLIEEFMIAANVAAAETLEARRQPCLYRVHDQPAPEKLHALAEFLDTLSLPFHKGTVQRASQFNGLLERAHGTPHEIMVNEIILRSQAQAEYTPDNIGHFGLALSRYAHFTSPIRRYADLMVHRGLIAGLGLGPDGRAAGGPDPDLAEIGRHITATERRAATAERDALARYTASFLQGSVGAAFPGRVSGLNRAGLFVTLDDSGADGLVPMSTLPDDYYRHDEAAHTLRGEHSGLTFHLGMAVVVRLRDANPISGGLLFELLEGGSRTAERRRAPRGGRRVLRRPRR
ncbi:ribonuclease R [Pararhodospirillum oryzae]|uniref:Ribonuclease R n=1 Tax=Pararhodospirillum oryzae TaxID=478448 RepID=A0A512H7J3_9PROT|nr:ribonuclease R [Pararhodospirillum oryzae]GEO81360.1 ribonuclease R [Pararhodospirillum oryzae]